MDFDPILARLGAAIEFGRTSRRLKRDEAARTVWHRVYPDLSEGKPGLAGALIARSEAQTARLADRFRIVFRA